MLHGLVLAPRLAAAQTPPAPPPRDTVPRRDTVPASVPIPARADTVPADRDSTGRTPRARPDSIKRPLMRAEAPLGTDSSTYWRWDREALFASGALDLLDLLERIPGLVGFRSAWIGSPSAATMLGDGRRVRLFYDGIELDALDPRTNGIADPVLAQIWTLEDVTIERSAGEVRVYMRTWRVDRTTPYTRTDVSTGDLATNTFRGFFGRRFTGGEVIQAGFQQFSTSRIRTGGDNDALELMARLGVARGKWKFDALLNRSRRTRSDIARIDPFTLAGLGTSLAGEEATYTTAYVRGGFGDPAAGLWLQATAASLGFRENTNSRTASEGIAADSADTTRSRAQYVLAGGYTRGPLAVSVTGRVRAFQGELPKNAIARASYSPGVFSATGYVERNGEEGSWRAEGMASVTPFNRLSLSGAVSQLRVDGGTIAGVDDAVSRTSVRGEAAVRVGQLWVGGGVITRDAAILPALTVFNDSAALVEDPAATGAMATLRGRLFKGISLDAYGIAWDGRGPYRPKYQSREQAYFSSSFPRRFPSGNFHLLFSLNHEYRTTVLFPQVTDDLVTARASHTVGGLLEIRIVNAVLSYQIRNALSQRNQFVPEFLAPNTTQVYGIRWEFYN